METLIPGIALAVIAITSTVGMATSRNDRRFKAMDRRLQLLERKMDLLLAHHGVEGPPEDPAFKEIDALLAQGKKIHAIKLHREATGSGLAEAKEAVERRMR
ncbi:hypothetical protein [Streptomyces sp. NPDC101150]|uniref:hypothetical protein n=1 Tax=Streptomyces sp. NPDC101150 TaxID=3366114 RepID=UPI0037FD0025